MEAALKVGALAERAGLTVRTLHHYDEIGLLEPRRRTSSGHRLYGHEEVTRLQRIASLRRLGLSLDEIRQCLSRPEYSLERVLELHIERIDEEIRRQEGLRDLLASLRARVRAAERVSLDELARTIDMTMNYGKYYTPEQLETLRARGERVGEERMREVQEEWTELFADFGKAMDRGLAPDHPDVAALTRRARALIEEFTGGDPGIADSLQTMYRTEGPERVMEGHGMPMRPGLWEYMGKARSALGSEG